MTAIAEWQAEFDDLAQGMRKRMQEIAVLTFQGDLISSLREYWASEPAGNPEWSSDKFEHLAARAGVPRMTRTGPGTRPAA